MKLITLNCEGKKHLDKIQNFIEQENPSVLCLQEICSDDAERLYRDYNFANFTFSMNNRNQYQGSDEISIEGNVLYSRYVQTVYHTYYYHECERDEIIDTSTELLHRQTESRNVQIATIAGVYDKPIRIANTHFTWTQDGLPNDYQRSDLAALLAYVDSTMPTLMCGDFNIPRAQNELYKSILNSGYADHVPQHIVSSLDISLHRCRDNVAISEILSQYMVDYVFSKNWQQFKPAIRQVFGVSDHSAFVLES